MMTLTIDLTPMEEIQLLTIARQQGLAPEDLARRFVTERLSPEPNSDPMLALFSAWEQDDNEMTPDQIAAENQQWQQFKADLNAERDRAGARRVV